MLRFLPGALGLVACVAAVAAEIDKPTLAWTQAVVDRWEVACRKYLHVAPHPLPWIIFFDDRSSWHLNPDKSELPGHTPLRAAVKFAGRDHEVVQVEHREGRLWVPGRDALPVKAGGATMPYYDDRRVFFELALPSLWRKESGSAPSRDLDELILGLALHELTHTRQMVDVSRRIEAMRSRHKLPESVNDNLIENTFSKIPDYKKIWDEEWAHLSRALLADDASGMRDAITEVLAASERRKARFFVGDYQGWSELEDIFLAMEGVAMWVHRMARDHAPPGESWQQTAGVLFTRGDAWSQMEGLALFLLIDRLVPGWQARFLAPGFPSPFAVLREAVSAAR
jgi:hypothetical protein